MYSVIKEFTLGTISVFFYSSWFKQITIKDSLFFSPYVLQLGVQHTSLHFPRLGDKVIVRSGGQSAWGPLLAISPTLLWLRPALLARSGVLAGCFCRVVQEKDDCPGALLGSLRIWKVGKDTARKSRRSIVILLLFSYCGKNNRKFAILTSSVKYGHFVVTHIFRTVPSCKSEALYSLNNKSPFLPAPSPW